jgi:hypothetical protein
VLVLSVLYAMLPHVGSPLAEGARFCALIGLFSVCSFVVHNHVNSNIGLGLTLKQSAAYLVEWMLTCIARALVCSHFAPPG